MCDYKISLKVITLSENVENSLRNNLVKDENGTRIELNQYLISVLMYEIEEKEKLFVENGLKEIPIICRPDIRLYFRRLIEKRFPRLQVISYLEIPPDYKLDVISTIDFKN